MGLNPTKKNVSIIASDKTWIDYEAIMQLEAVAAWPGMLNVVGMPDLHPGRGLPIGASFITNEMIYPALIGNDIGCGMGLWQTDLLVRKVKLDKLTNLVERFDDNTPGNPQEWLERFQLESTIHDNSLGTIGAGNHFAELLRVEEIHNENVFKDAHLDKDYLLLLVHSGSRGLGEEILRKHTFLHGTRPLPKNDTDYITQHDHAVRWAKANRNCIASRIFDVTRSEGSPILDICHNCVCNLGQGRWLHRKGAAPSNEGLIIVPGSRGDFSYLVKPLGDGAAHAYSLPHGAGRKWKRSDCRGRLEKRFSMEALKQTELGSRVICQDKALLYEEAPQAYKNITTVIESMTNRGFIEVIARFRPVITFKKGGQYE